MRRQAVADYLATSQQQTTIGFLMAMQSSVDKQSAVKEIYLNSRHLSEIKGLAQALDLDDLLLAAETPIDRMVRKAKTERISKLSNVLTSIAAQKQAAEQ